MNYIEVRNELILKAAKTKTPIAGEIELTPACNLSCVMCYVREKKPQKELTTEEWKKIIFEAKEAGLLFVLFTGGEIFLRKDFQEIYEYTYDLGIRISLFTNGSLINDQIIAYLLKRKPDLIAITMYGVTSEQYKEVTGCGEAFYQIHENIRKLKKVQLPLVVRTIAIKTIYNNIDQIIEYFKNESLSVTYSLYVGPRRCNKQAAVKRLTPIELLDYEAKFQKAFGISHKIQANECEKGFSCVAGKSSYFITWDAYLSPCAMLNTPREKIASSFKEAWHRFIPKLQDIPLCEGYEECQYKKFCLQCPARRYLEGDFTKCSQYLKDIAKLKMKQEL